MKNMWFYKHFKKFKIFEKNGKFSGQSIYHCVNAELQTSLKEFHAWGGCQGPQRLAHLLQSEAMKKIDKTIRIID